MPQLVEKIREYQILGTKIKLIFLYREYQTREEEGHKSCA